MAVLHNLDMSTAGEMQTGFEPFPPGEYVMYMEESEVVPTKANDGEYLKTTFIVKDGEFANRKVWHIFNLWNKSEKSVEQAKREWRAVCEATIGQPNALNGDSETLHFKPFIGTVKVTPAKDQWPAKNEMVFTTKQGVKSIRSLQEQGQAPVGVQSSPAAVAPTATATVSQANPQVAAAVASAGAARPAWAKR